MPRISPKNPRIDGIQKRTVRRGDAVARRDRHCRCMGWAAIASHNASISRRRSLGSPSTTPCPKLRRAHPSRPALPNTHVRGAQRKKRERQGKVTLTTISCVPVYVRARFVLSATIPVLRERSSSVYTRYRVTLYREWARKRTPALLRCFGVIEGEMRRANKWGGPGGNE